MTFYLRSDTPLLPPIYILREMAFFLTLFPLLSQQRERPIPLHHVKRRREPADHHRPDAEPSP